MDFYKALQIIGLSNNYTEKELRKKYHDLARTYHPDAYVDKSLEEQKMASDKMKEINEAYDILAKALKGKRYYSTFSNNDNDEDNDNEFNNTDLQKYKDNILNFINKNNNISIKVSDVFSEDISSFKNFISEYSKRIKEANSKKIIDSIYDDYKELLKRYYKDFKYTYFTKNNIPLESYFIINTMLSINEFYKSLENFKNYLYNNVVKEVDDVISFYKNSTYYNDIKDKVEKLKSETVASILSIDSSLYDYKINEDFYLNSLKSEIEDLIKIISINKPLYLELKEIINKDYLPFEEDLEKLEKNLYSPLFPLFYQELKLKVTTILDCCFNHDDEIKEIENNLTNKYNEAINNIKDGRQSFLIKHLYDSIFNFLSTRKYTNFESIKLLNKIDFNNYEEASKIYNCVLDNLNTDKEFEIYLDQNKANTIVSKHVVIDNEEYDVSTLNNEQIVHEIYRDMDSNVISLNLFMICAEEFFSTFEWRGETCVGLYRWNNLILCIYKEHLEFLNECMISNINQIEPREYIIFKGKQFIESLIINDCYRNIEKFKENKKAKKRKR